VVKWLSDRVKIIPIPRAFCPNLRCFCFWFSNGQIFVFGIFAKKEKKKRNLKEILESKYPVIFYESPYRILRTLKELRDAMNNEQRVANNILVARELTKKFETIYRGKN